MGVVGVGVMGQLHAKTINECDSSELVAIVDSNEKIGKEIANKYGVKYYSSVDKALEDEEIEAYSVVLPDRLHVDVTSKILLSGKDVLLEKPMADTLEGAKKIADAAKNGGSRLMIAHIMRFDPRYAKAAEVIRNGEIGDVVHVTGKRLSYQDVGIRMNGNSSVLFYLGIHDVDAMQWVVNKKIKKVFARSVSKIMPMHNVDSEDAIVASFEYEDGTIGSLTVGWSVPENMPSGINAELEIIGTKGVLSIDTSDHGITIVRPNGVELPDGLHWPEVYGKVSGNLKDEILHFVTAVRDNKEFAISVQEAMDAVAVNDAILKSIEDKAEVTIKN